MAYTEIDNSTDFFRTKLYTGNGADGQAITYDESENMTPNFVWIKERNSTSAHKLIDSVRGANKAMSSDQTEAERTHQYLADFNDANGFTIGTTDGGTNQNNNTFVSWNWKAGTAFSNDASSTSVGTIDSAGSVNTDAGFSIISYTGTGSAATIAHGLGVKPDWIISKIRSTTGDWNAYHDAFGATGRIKFNSTGAGSNNTSIFAELPTSSVISVGNGGDINTSSGTHIFYCFAGKQGYSKFGSYTGNGNADGSFVYLGFKPAFLIIKCTDAARSWQIHNSKSSPFNTGNTNARLFANLTDAEATNSSLDLLSNGFKVREADDLNTNGSGNAYIYMAFAENPFVTSTGVPATAR